jgi:hypothetical protein
MHYCRLSSYDGATVYNALVNAQVLQERSAKSADCQPRKNTNPMVQCPGLQAPPHWNKRVAAEESEFKLRITRAALFSSDYSNLSSFNCLVRALTRGDHLFLTLK